MTNERRAESGGMAQTNVRKSGNQKVSREELNRLIEHLPEEVLGEGMALLLGLLRKARDTGPLPLSDEVLALLDARTDDQRA